jgi:hypothetical protein
LHALPPSFTLTFWVIKIDDLTNRVQWSSFNMIQAFDRVYFKAHIVGTSMHCIGIEFKVQGNVF